MTHRPDDSTPELTELAGMIWRCLLIGAIAILGWHTLSTARDGDISETLATAAVLLAVVGILLASALVARGRR